MSDKEKGVKKEKLNWFLRLITLGDRFSLRDFYDKLKEGAVNFAIVFFGVLLSFGVEQKGMRDDERDDGIENLYKLREKARKLLQIKASCEPNHYSILPFEYGVCHKRLL